MNEEDRISLFMLKLTDLTCEGPPLFSRLLRHYFKFRDSGIEQSQKRKLSPSMLYLGLETLSVHRESIDVLLVKKPYLHPLRTLENSSMKMVQITSEEARRNVKCFWER